MKWIFGRTSSFPIKPAANESWLPRIHIIQVSYFSPSKNSPAILFKCNTVLIKNSAREGTNVLTTPFRVHVNELKFVFRLLLSTTPRPGSALIWRGENISLISAPLSQSIPVYLAAWSVRGGEGDISSGICIVSFLLDGCSSRKFPAMDLLLLDLISPSLVLFKKKLLLVLQIRSILVTNLGIDDFWWTLLSFWNWWFVTSFFTWPRTVHSYQKG